MNARRLAFVAAIVLTATAGSASAALEQVRVVRSLTGTHVWYQQTHAGHPVLDAYVERNFDRVGAPLSIHDGSRAVPGRPAAARGRGVASAGSLAVLPGPHARLVSVTYTDTQRIARDVRTGRVVQRRVLARFVTGQGRVFDPNPVVALANEELTDEKDSDYAAIAGAYVTRPLQLLDSSGCLTGSYVDVQGTKSKACGVNNSYSFNRSQDGFEQTIAYLAVTNAQLYIRSLGFTNVNADAQEVKVNQLGVDNSYYSPQQDVIKFGKGGVDDAEDEEVVWHELGHAIQDSQVPGFGSTVEAGSIGEGFGDFWAVLMSEGVQPAGSDLACVADWDSVSYTAGPVHCLRRVDTDLTVADTTGEVHHDGEIWSRALWDIHAALGRDATAKIVLESQYSYAPDTSFAAAAQQVVAAAQALYGRQAAKVATRAFQARGIL